jgi:methylenetetrahydrofolate--tRNA-(uracil-5-)-methyltransferase
LQLASLAPNDHRMTTARIQAVHIIGGGLAGSEAAWQIAQSAVPVILHEMRPLRTTPVHKTDGYAELVCSNSFRSDDAERNAVGLLHEEMRRLGSLIMRAADANQVPAGGALAVDRDGFSAAISAELSAHPLIELTRGEITLPDDDWNNVIIATGPLTSPGLTSALANLTGEQQLAFFDAIAPIVHRDSIDFSQAWFQSRYDKAGPGGSGADYINCPLTRDQYETFVAALLAADKMAFHEWESPTPYFDGCLPIEIMAERGPETLRHGPMKPFGLTNPHEPGAKPYAVVQLRQDNKLGTLFNMVGFQTKLKHGEQVRIFRTIPGLQNAEFARLGGLHRNTFLNSPKLLDEMLRLKIRPQWRFAGQITGCEGYVESAAIGLLAGRFAAADWHGEPAIVPPPTTAHGALLAHITGGHIETIDSSPSSFQPMNVNFGLFPQLLEQPVYDRKSGLGRTGAKAMARKTALTRRALADLDHWIASNHVTVAAE